MTHFSSVDYFSAGLATLSRQVICFAIAKAPLKGHPVYIAANLTIKFAVHQFNLRVLEIESAMDASLILAEQTAYPLLLQVSEEMDRLMAAQLTWEDKQIALAELIHPLLLLIEPLAYLSIGNYIDSMKAQKDAHTAVLLHFESLWEWKTATVTYVIDGDTFKVDIFDESVRFEDIDCPEPDSDKGKAAKAYTESHLLGKEVELRVRKQLDDYGRRVAIVYLDGKNIGYELVRNGLAKFSYVKR